MKAGVDPRDVRFDNLPQIGFALASWRDFERQKRAGNIAPGVRYQVCLAGPISVMRRFLADEAEQDAVTPAYERGLIEAVRSIAARIPAGELAIQWDVASAVFEALEIGRAHV